MRLARLEAQIPDHLRKDYDLSRRAIYEEHVRLIREGVEAGEFRPVDAQIAAFSIIGMANWTSRWYRADGRLSAPEVAEAISDLALSSVCGPEASDYRLDKLRTRLGAVIDDLGGIADSIGLSPESKP
jgi:hypothetical protein